MTETNTTPAADAAKADAPTARKGHLAAILPDGTVAYRRTENPYTHVVAGRKGDEWTAVTWSASWDNAAKAMNARRFTASGWDQSAVVEVVDLPAAVKAPKAPKAAKVVDPDATPIVRAQSTVAKDGEMTCRVCNETQAVTKFPTTKDKDGAVVRVDRCRACRDAAAADRAAAKAAG